MISHTLLALAALSLAAAAPDAPIVQSNPAGATYLAVLPNSNTTSIRGEVTGTSNNNGTGVEFVVSFNNIPSTGGPYIYHIHEFPVPSDGNCTGTGAHLDPEDRGEKPPCDPSSPQQCQVGDLAGKHGSINTTAYSAQSVYFPQGTTGMVLVGRNGTDRVKLRYLDLFVSSLPDTSAYFGNRSIVVHNGAGDRLTCANFTLLSTGVGNTTASAPAATATASGAGVATSTAASAATASVSTTTTTTNAASTPTIQPFKGGAATKSLSASAVLLGILAFFL